MGTMERDTYDHNLIITNHSLGDGERNRGAPRRRRRRPLTLQVRLMMPASPLQRPIRLLRLMLIATVGIACTGIFSAVLGMLSVNPAAPATSRLLDAPTDTAIVVDPSLESRPLQTPTLLLASQRDAGVARKKKSKKSGSRAEQTSRREEASLREYQQRFRAGDKIGEGAPPPRRVVPPPPPPQPLPQPVRLLRIPKAGSSSFSAFLRLQYNCTSAEHPPGDCVKRNRRQCRVVEGCSDHKDAGDWKTDEAAKPMLTFVRDPVARYMSAYRYPGHHGKGTGGNITKHTILFPEYDNSQTNFLSRHPIGTWAVQGRGNRARQQPPDGAQPSAEEWQNRLRESADLIESDKLRFVGLLEHWNDSLRLFCRMFVCARLDDSLNAKPERQQSVDDLYHYSAAAVRVVEEANAIDRRLYQLAVARFCRDLAQFRDDAVFMDALHRDTVELCEKSSAFSSST